MTQVGLTASSFNTKWFSLCSCPRAAGKKDHKLGGLKQWDILSLSLSARNAWSRCGQDYAFSEDSSKEPLCATPSFRGPPAILGFPGLVAASLDSPPASLHGLLPVHLCVSKTRLFLLKTWVSDLGTTSLQDDLISTRLHLQRLHFQIRSPSQVWGLGSGHTWGNISTHYALRPAPGNGGSSGMAGRKRQEAGQCPRAPPGLSTARRGMDKTTWMHTPW